MFLTDFQEKANIFSSFFAKQFTLVSNHSVLLSELTLMMVEGTHSITFSESENIKIIRALDVNKMHGHDNIFFGMIKLSDNSVTYPLTFVFQNSLAAVTFATQWKRANIVPVDKKNDKQIVSNYQPVFLFCLCSVKFLKSLF